MVGITLSPEQIQQAPPEVRRWIEQQIASALGLSAPRPSSKHRHAIWSAATSTRPAPFCR